MLMDCKFDVFGRLENGWLIEDRFADGSKTENGDAYGAWLVMNTKDTYFGGPLHSDLVVDGILYNYISSNHHGDQTVSPPLGRSMTGN
jgi:hypothetical protein